MQTELISGLRDLADFLEAKDLEVKGSLTVNLWAKDREELQELARKLGSFEKHSFSSLLVLRKYFSDTVLLEVNCHHEKVCEKIVTQRVIPATPEKTLPTLPERVEEVVEWKCPESLLRR